MQSRVIAHLARRIRSLALRTNYCFAAAELHILDDDGCPNPGLAYRIAEHGAMPNDYCMQRLIRDRAIPRPEPQPLHLDRQTVTAICRALQHDEPLPPLSAKIRRRFGLALQPKRIR